MFPGLPNELARRFHVLLAGSGGCPPSLVSLVRSGMSGRLVESTYGYQKEKDPIPDRSRRPDQGMADVCEAPLRGQLGFRKRGGGILGIRHMSGLRRPATELRNICRRVGSIRCVYSFL